MKGLIILLCILTAVFVVFLTQPASSLIQSFKPDDGKFVLLRKKRQDGGDDPGGDDAEKTKFGGDTDGGGKDDTGTGTEDADNTGGNKDGDENADDNGDKASKDNTEDGQTDDDKTQKDNNDDDTNNDKKGGGDDQDGDNGDDTTGKGKKTKGKSGGGNSQSQGGNSQSNSKHNNQGKGGGGKGGKNNDDNGGDGGGDYPDDGNGQGDSGNGNGRGNGGRRGQNGNGQTGNDEDDYGNQNDNDDGVDPNNDNNGGPRSGNSGRRGGNPMGNQQNDYDYQDSGDSPMGSPNGMGSRNGGNDQMGTGGRRGRISVEYVRLRCQDQDGVYLPISTICENELDDATCNQHFPIDPSRPGERPTSCDHENSAIAVLSLKCAKHCMICCERKEHGCGDYPDINPDSNRRKFDINCIAEKHHCTHPELQDLMRIACAGTCGLCNTGECKDTMDGCIGFRNACSRENRLDDSREDLQRVCARSCRYCDPVCEDKALDCVDRDKSGCAIPPAGHSELNPLFSTMAVECRKTCGLCEYIIVSELKRYRERFPSLRLWTDLLDDDPVASGNSHSNLLGYLPHSLGSGNKLPCMDKKDDCNERPLEHCADPPDGHPELNPYHAEMISDCPLRCGKCDQYAVELQQEQRLAELSDSRLQSAYDRISKIYDHLLPNSQNGIGINYANRLSQNNDGGSIGRQRISQVNGRRPQQMLRQKRQAQVYEEGSEEEWSEGNGQSPNYPNVQSNQNYPPYPQNPQNPQNYPNSPNYGQNHPSNYPNNPNNNYPQVNPNYPQVNPNSQNYGPNYPTSNQNNPQIYPSNNPSYLSPNYANGLNYPPNNDPNCAVPSASGTVVEEGGEEEMGGYRK